MTVDPNEPLHLREELAALVGQARDCRDRDARHALFDALRDLETRALGAGASRGTLRRIGEARFLAGILREAVVPVRHQGPRSILRLRRDVEPVCEPVGQG